MSDPLLTFHATVHFIVGAIGRVRPDTDLDDPHADRGAVSIETVLWYAAAAVGVAVIAGIIWTQVKTSADEVTPNVPAAP